MILTLPRIVVDRTHAPPRALGSRGAGLRPGDPAAGAPGAGGFVTQLLPQAWLRGVPRLFSAVVDLGTVPEPLRDRRRRAVGG